MSDSVAVSPWRTAAVVFAASFFAFSFLFLAAPVIPDADSYYHLAVAREYAAGNFMDALPWARLSVLGETFGDKELLFHVALAPFTVFTDAASGGRLALAACNALVAAAMAAAATPALGWWSMAVPAWLYLAAPLMTFRLIRLRPELFALLLLLALIHVAARRRWVVAALVAAVFALSYTAVQVVPGLAVLWAASRWREREWQLPVATTAGAIIGLLLHPQFPANVRIWWIVNVHVFLRKAQLDVGTEYLPPSTEIFLVENLGWWAGVALLIYAARGSNRSPRGTWFSMIAAAVFLVLTLLMQRMGIYLVAFATLMLLYKLPPLPPRRAAAAAASLLAVSLLSWPATRDIVRDLLTEASPELTWEADYARFGRAVPPGAKVAAHWGPAEFYTFWAPQGRYLNVLDPTFMALPFPREYRAQRKLFEAREPDVPHVAANVLGSDYIAFSAVASPALHARVRRDPRITPLYSGFSFLGRIEREKAAMFVRDWHLPDGRRYPPLPNGAAFIDAGRVSRNRCVALTHELTLAAPATRVFELAPYGPATIDAGDVHRQVRTMRRAVLGQGVMMRLHLPAGTTPVRVVTCAAEDGTNGFYFLERRR